MLGRVKDRRRLAQDLGEGRQEERQVARIVDVAELVDRLAQVGCDRELRGRAAACASGRAWAGGEGEGETEGTKERQRGDLAGLSGRADGREDARRAGARGKRRRRRTLTLTSVGRESMRVRDSTSVSCTRGKPRVAKRAGRRPSGLQAPGEQARKERDEPLLGSMSRAAKPSQSATLTALAAPVALAAVVEDDAPGVGVGVAGGGGAEDEPAAAGVEAAAAGLEGCCWAGAAGGAAAAAEPSAGSAAAGGRRSDAMGGGRERRMRAPQERTRVWPLAWVRWPMDGGGRGRV